MPQQRKYYYVYRDARSGRWVTRKFAERYPHLTVRERRKRG